mgnify:FL=1|jgi:hypothetical protein|tara:strand:+ start:348 stop:467 length:120 start_codon:yes stop_codon:yes gene_type:complete
METFLYEAVTQQIIKEEETDAEQKQKLNDWIKGQLGFGS